MRRLISPSNKNRENRRERKERKFIKILSTGLICALLLSSLSCGQNKTEESIPSLKEPVGVVLDTETVTRGELISYVSYSGQVNPEVREHYFETDGTLEEILVYSGQYVEKDTVLMTLNAEAVKKQIESIQEQIDELNRNAAYADEIADLNIRYLTIELQEAEKAFGANSKNYRMKSLEIEEAVLKKNQTIESRQRTLTSLNEQLEKLNTEAENQVLKAKASGRVFYADSVEPGNYIRALRTICYIADTSDPIFEITESMVNDQVLKQEELKAEILGESYDIIYQPLSDDERMRYLMSGQIPPTRFKFKDTGAVKDLAAGTYGVLIGELLHLEDVLTVPNTSLYKEGIQSYVYVVEDGSRIRKDVTISRTNGIRTVVTEGLQEGEQVYVKE